MSTTSGTLVGILIGVAIAIVVWWFFTAWWYLYFLPLAPLLIEVTAIWRLINRTGKRAPRV